MLVIRDGDTSVLRCIKFGYDLSKRKDMTSAANCEAFMPKVVDKNLNAEQEHPERKNEKAPNQIAASEQQHNRQSLTEERYVARHEAGISRNS